MEIKIKQLKKLVKDETIISKATEIDTQGAEGSIKDNKILEAGEIPIFETQIRGSLDSKTYQAIFGFEKTERAPDSPMDMTTATGNGNFIVSDKPITIETNAQFNPNGTIKDNVKLAKGSITFTDELGDTRTIPIEIDIKHLYGENKKAEFDELLKDLQKAIQSLPPNLKSDLVNEINKIRIGTENAMIDADDGKGARFSSPLGSFSPETSTLTLNRCKNGNIIKDGVNMNTLAHELGHAKDELGSEYQSKTDFANAFKQMKSALKLTNEQLYNLIQKDLEQGYWFQNEKEAFAELTGYFAEIEAMKKNGQLPHFDKDSRYYYLNQVMTSDNPNIKPIAQEMLTHYKTIVKNTNSQTPTTRKGNNNINAAKKRISISGFKFDKKIDPELYNNYISLIYEDDFYDYFNDGKTSQDIMLQYWQYLHKDSTDTNDKTIYDSLDDKTKEIFTKLDKRAEGNPPLESWKSVRKGLQKYLENINLK